MSQQETQSSAVPTYIVDWRPEDASFWESTGKSVANRNLWISIPALLLAFSVWQIWSVLTVRMKEVGFPFTDAEFFALAGYASLLGATLRIFYSFVVPIFGGRNWTAISTASLLLPVLGLGWAIQDKTTTYSVFVVLALLCGFGSGNFASSMSNINYFFSKSKKGLALGLNAGLGNLGVSVVQFVIPWIITIPVLGFLGRLGQNSYTVMKGGVEKVYWLQNAGWFWVPLIAISTIAAWVGMNNLGVAKASFSDQAVIFKRKHNWIMCWLYLGTFGSFIGYSAGFPLLIKTQFKGIDALQYAFYGPLIGAISRPVGGWISDKLGGAFVTFWTFLGMIGAVVGVLHYLGVRDFAGFFTMFIILFMLTGIGNASTFRMIPFIFINERAKEAEGKGSEAEAQAAKDAAKESGAVLGFSSAIGAYGGYIVPKCYGWSTEATGGPQAALIGFIVFYVTCVALTWWFYSRKGAEAPC